MTRTLYLDDEHERYLELATRYMRTLAAVERAHALDDQDDVEAILGGVDPLDLKIVGEEIELLRSLYRTTPIRIAAEPRARTLGRDDPPKVDRARSDGAESPSSAVTFPKVQCR